MAYRDYEPRPWSFQYDFADNGGAVGFLSLGGQIPPGWTFATGMIKTLVTVTSALTTGMVTLAGSVDGAFSAAVPEASLTAVTTFPFTNLLVVPSTTAGIVQQDLGITISGDALITGRFVAFGTYAIITE